MRRHFKRRRYGRSFFYKTECGRPSRGLAEHKIEHGSGVQICQDGTGFVRGTRCEFPFRKRSTSKFDATLASSQVGYGTRTAGDR